MEDLSKRNDLNRALSMKVTSIASDEANKHADFSPGSVVISEMAKKIYQACQTYWYSLPGLKIFLYNCLAHEYNLNIMWCLFEKILPFVVRFDATQMQVFLDLLLQFGTLCNMISLSCLWQYCQLVYLFSPGIVPNYLMSSREKEGEKGLIFGRRMNKFHESLNQELLKIVSQDFNAQVAAAPAKRAAYFVIDQVTQFLFGVSPYLVGSSVLFTGDAKADMDMTIVFSPEQKKRLVEISKLYEEKNIENFCPFPSDLRGRPHMAHFVEASAFTQWCEDDIVAVIAARMLGNVFDQLGCLVFCIELARVKILRVIALVDCDKMKFVKMTQQHCQNEETLDRYEVYKKTPPGVRDLFLNLNGPLLDPSILEKNEVCFASENVPVQELRQEHFKAMNDCVAAYFKKHLISNLVVASQLGNESSISDRVKLVEFEISFNHEVAIHNTRLIGTYLGLNPYVRPLTLFIKKWARSLKLYKTFDGFPSGYQWSLMVIHFLQQYCPEGCENDNKLWPLPNL